MRARSIAKHFGQFQRKIVNSADPQQTTALGAIQPGRRAIRASTQLSGHPPCRHAQQQKTLIMGKAFARAFSLADDTSLIILQFELRQFREMAVLWRVSPALSVSQPLHPISPRKSCPAPSVTIARRVTIALYFPATGRSPCNPPQTIPLSGRSVRSSSGKPARKHDRGESPSRLLPTFTTSVDGAPRVKCVARRAADCVHFRRRCRFSRSLNHQDVDMLHCLAQKSRSSARS